MKQLIRFLPLIVFSFFIFSSPAAAFYIQSGQNISLPPDKTFNETVIIAGNTLVIDSDITGDLICAGQNITVNGSVKGDLICAGQNLKINGPVDGNVRLVGQNLDFLKTAAVKGDLLAAGQQLNLSSSVGRDVLVAVQKINLDPATKIGGNFDFYRQPDSEATVAAKNVKGKLTSHLLPQSVTPAVEVSQVKRSVTVFSKIISVFSILIIGLFLLLVFKSPTENLALSLQKSPVRLFFLGFAVIFLTPVFIVILFLTLIGIPLAFVLMLLYLLGFLIAIPLSAFALGQIIHPNRYLALLIGAVIFTIFSLLPLIGWLFGLIFLSVGFGLYSRLFFDNKKL